MARQDETIALTSFLYGGNAAYIEDLYARYEADPASVDAQWQAFFSSLGDDRKDVVKNASGPSWTQANWPVTPGGELISALDGNWAAVEKAIGDKLKAKAADKGKGAEITAEQVQQATRDSVRALMLIRAYRMRGHLHANLDPIGLDPPKTHEELDPTSYGFTEADYDRKIFIDKVLGLEFATIREMVVILERTYCQTIGVEFMHISDPAQKSWLQERIEGPDKEITFTKEGKRAILQKLVEAEGFEKFLDIRYTGTKRFGLDGGESMIPALEQIIKRGGNLGVKEIVMGMAHRGRLNTLTQVMGKPHRALFHEFKGGSFAPDDVEGSGDVKYHLGASSDREFDGNKVHLSLTPNPSHLEIVNPVVLGKVRAKQDQHGCSPEDRTASPEDRTAVLPLLIHGDAAFAGQGVVAECFGLSGLKGHRTGGSIHFIINNQIGFTTYPRYSRSSPYPSDVAKMVEAPIFHVNGDDPEAVVFAAKVATEFRQKFQKPVVIDMWCYRRFGHNEGDEPAFTQPLMYKKIRGLPTTLDTYSKKLIAEGVVTEGEVDKMKADWRARLDAEMEAGQSYKPNKADWLDGKWAGLSGGASSDDDPRRGASGVERDQLVRVGAAITRVPEGFSAHRTIQRFMDNRRKVIDTGEGLDWATAEALAFGTLCDEGYRVRLSGQDCERGTFSQRHSVLIDQETEARYTPLNNIKDDQGRYEVINSMLSEEAVLGYEYGYSLAEPNALTMWEGQFGDFANGAQVVFDQFISSAERKWLRLSGLGALLRPPRALPADVRRGQHAGRQLHDAGQLLPHPAPAAEARDSQAPDPDDAEVAAPPQAGGLPARRARHRHLVPPCVVGRCPGPARAGNQARRRQEDPARGVVLWQGLLRPLRGPHQKGHRRRLSDACRAALSVPAQGACPRDLPVQERRGDLVPGGAEEHGLLDLRGALPGMGAGHRRLQGQARPLCRPTGLRRDRHGPPVPPQRSAPGLPGRSLRMIRSGLRGPDIPTITT
ncbi:MAG: 2-oxoglutarate dehydrogenase E1 component [Xanthobacteraceae bacterium]|nr:MAG: 2-oxoglutarate dehydrogenase E1 component [Xanthobacteraceae bacterium]